VAPAEGRPQLQILAGGPGDRHHWLKRHDAEDQQRHLADRPRLCPWCGRSYGEGIIVEYWTADTRVFHCWCSACRRAAEVSRADRVITHHLEH